MSVHCPCGTGKAYNKCCKPFHYGLPVPNAMLLMRSRYSAYAKHLPQYIMRTTHPASPHHNADVAKWSQDILLFCQHTQFVKLDVEEFIDGEQTAYVRFTAHLRQHGVDFELQENSLFEKVNGHWLYLDKEG